jgi:hypothetical protein
MSFSNHNEQSGDGATNSNKQAAKIIEGDEVAGDKVGQQVQGDNHGTMDQVNVTAGDYNAKAKEAVGNLLTEMAKDFAPLDPVDSLPVDEATPGTPIEPEYHPLGIMADIEAMADAEEPPTEEEQSSLRERFGKMLSKAGDIGKAALVKAGPVAVAGMKATASMTSPFNIICPMVEAAVRVFTEKPEATYEYDGYQSDRGW